MQVEEELKRGSNLKLARRHKKIIPGQIKGDRIWEPKVCSPGVTGIVSLRFTVSGFLAEESRIVLNFPQQGWIIPSSPNITVKLHDGVLPFTLSSSWDHEKRCLEFTTLDAEIDPGTDIELLISGITTPECSVGPAEITITTFEKKIIRNTVPPSTRGGQIVDGPSVIATVKIPPGNILGPRTWTARDFEPGKAGDVSLEFQLTGAIPQYGKILVELPDDGWDMSATPHVVLKVGQNGSTELTEASWDIVQRTLGITVLHDHIPMGSKLSFTISDVSNPEAELSTQFGRITTLAPTGGGVIDGPGKLELSRISRLTEKELQKVIEAFDEVDEEEKGKIELSLLPQVFEKLAIVLDENLYQRLVLDQISILHDEETPDVSFVEKEAFIACLTVLYRPGNKFGQSLRVSCARGEEENVRELVSRGCNPNGKDGSGWTSLHHAAAYGRVSILQALNDPSLEINAKDNCGWTPLHNAASNGHTAAVQLLIEMGSDVNLTNHQGRTALDWAAVKGYDEIVRVLAQNGADINNKDEAEFTPLHHAALHGSILSMKALIEAGADHTQKDKLGYDVWKYCDEQEKQQLNGLFTHAERLQSAA